MNDQPAADNGAEDEEQRLKDRLAALEALHESGELSDEEYAIARRLAIFGPMGSAAPDGPPAPKQGAKSGSSSAPTTAGSGPRRRCRLRSRG